MKWRAIILICFCAFGLYLFAQDVGELTGLVTDESGEALIGVNVQIKGSNKGVSTDFEGRYEIDQVNENAVLVFSYIGYLIKELEVSGRSSVDVVLSANARQLDEIEVSALGIKRAAKSFSYSTQLVEGASLYEAEVVNSLLGKVAEVVISQRATGSGVSSKVLLRGNRSAASSNQPLCVIDGLSFNREKVSMFLPVVVASE